MIFGINYYKYLLQYGVCIVRKYAVVREKGGDLSIRATRRAFAAGARPRTAAAAAISRRVLYGVVCYDGRCGGRQLVDRNDLCRLGDSDGRGHATDQRRARRRFRPIPDVDITRQIDYGPTGIRVVIIGLCVLFESQQRVRVRRLRRRGVLQPMSLARFQFDDRLVQCVQAFLVDVRRGRRPRHSVLRHGDLSEGQTIFSHAAPAPVGRGLRQHQRHWIDGHRGWAAVTAFASGRRFVYAVRAGQLLDHRLSGRRSSSNSARTCRRRIKRTTAFA